MSNIGDLSTAVLDYLNTAGPAILDSTLDLGGDASARATKIANLFLVAANNARKRAEMKHDFSFADVTVSGIIPSDNSGLGYEECYMTRYTGTLVVAGGAGAGTLTVAGMPHNGEAIVLITDQANETGIYVRRPFTLSTHTSPYSGNTTVTSTKWADGTYTVWCYSLPDGRTNYVPYDPKRLVNIKTVGHPWYYDTEADLWRPIRFTTQNLLADKLIENLDRQPDNQVTYDQPWILGFGRRFYTYPTSSDAISLKIDVNRWMPAYVNSTDTDFFLEQGFEYMMYACIVELNHLLKVFVIRQDGNLPPPTTERDQALEEFIRWDVFQNEQNQNFQLE